MPGKNTGEPGICLFLDRDGTLIEHIPYLHDPNRVRLLPGVREAVHKALDAGCLLFLFTNQSGVGRGMFSMEEVEACNLRMFELLGLKSGDFAGICVAPENPNEKPLYRKPNPRYIREMIRKHHLDPNRCWVIGDSECDLQAAGNAAVKGMRVGETMGLAEAVDTILASSGNL